MLSYRSDLKNIARVLRKNMTDSEQILWQRLRGKQILGVQFYRQKPIGNYIVDFLAPRAKLVVEIDGSQHLEKQNYEKDRKRDTFFAGIGLKVLRFDSRQVLKQTDAVVEVIYRNVEERIQKSP